MSVRYEGADAQSVMFDLLPGGSDIGLDTVPEGEYALCFNYDEVFYVQGTKQDLENLLNRGLRLLATQED